MQHDPELTANTCACIAPLVHRVELAGVPGAHGDENVHSEVPKKLDMIASERVLEPPIPGWQPESLQQRVPVILGTRESTE